MANSCFCIWRVTFGNRASNDYFLAKRTCSIEVASLSEATGAYRLWVKFLQIKQPTEKISADCFTKLKSLYFFPACSAALELGLNGFCKPGATSNPLPGTPLPTRMSSLVITGGITE